MRSSGEAMLQVSELCCRRYSRNQDKAAACNEQLVFCKVVFASHSFCMHGEAQLKSTGKSAAPNVWFTHCSIRHVDMGHHDPHISCGLSSLHYSLFNEVCTWPCRKIDGVILKKKKVKHRWTRQCVSVVCTVLMKWKCWLRQKADAGVMLACCWAYMKKRWPLGGISVRQLVNAAMMVNCS